jgi:hypothetical protein
MTLYTLIFTILTTLHIITYGIVTLDHITKSARSSLLQNSYYIGKYITTPEQDQVNYIGIFKKPAYSV